MHSTTLHTHTLRLRERTATARLLYGCDVREGLRTLPDASVHMACTSPPYFGLRDYGAEGQIGLEDTPDAFVASLVEVFREVKRVLRPDGTLWVNLGDSYNNAGSSKNGTGLDGRQRGGATGPAGECGYKKRDLRHTLATSGIKHKDLIGIPWRVAFALQADGWYLRQDIIWHKPNPMPESVTDRCTKAHEYVFLFAHPDSGGRYYYDAEAVKEACSEDMQRRASAGHTRGAKGKLDKSRQDASTLRGSHAEMIDTSKGRNRRSVWTVSTKPYQGAHFATWPPDLVEPMILAATSAGGCCAACGAPWVRETEKLRTSYDGSKYAERIITRSGGILTGGTKKSTLGSSQGVSKTKTLGWIPGCTCDSDTVPSTVLDPFSGSATTGAVALPLGRNYIGIDLNPDYLSLAIQRLQQAHAKDNPDQCLLFGS